MGTIGPVPKSARRWARTAHLHEVKSGLLWSSKSVEGSTKMEAMMGHENGHLNGNAEGDVFSPRTVANGVHEKEPGSLSFDEADVGEGDGWVDTDADESEAELMKAS